MLAAAAGVVAAARGFPARAEGGSVRIAGTGGAAATIRLLAQAYLESRPGRADVAIRVLPNLGTSGGIAAMLEGVVDIALAGRAPTDAEAVGGIVETPYSRTPLAFATNPGRGAAAFVLTLDDVARIYAGDLAAWADGTPIRLVRRPATDSDTLALSAASPAMARAVAAAQRRPGFVTAGTDQDNADALEAVRGSFGVITLAQILSEERRLTLLPLGGVEPTPEAVAAGRYPLARTFRFVTRPAPAPAAAAFMAFVAGPEGGAILARLGQEPLRSGHPGDGA